MNPNYKNNICKVLFEEEWFSYDFAKPRGITPYTSRLDWNNTFITAINRMCNKIVLETQYDIPIFQDVCAILSDVSICDILGNQLYHSETTKAFDTINVRGVELYPVGKLRGHLEINITHKSIFKKGRSLILEKSNMKGLSGEFLLLWSEKHKKGGIINIRNE